VAIDVALLVWTFAWWGQLSPDQGYALAGAIPWAVDECGDATFPGVAAPFTVSLGILGLVVTLRPTSPRGLGRGALVFSLLTSIAVLFPWVAGLFTGCEE